MKWFCSSHLIINQIKLKVGVWGFYLTIFILLFQKVLVLKYIYNSLISKIQELFVHDHRCVYSLLNSKIDRKYDVFCIRDMISLFFYLTCTWWNFGTFIVKHFRQVIRILTNKLIKCRNRLQTCVFWWTA